MATLMESPGLTVHFVSPLQPVRGVSELGSSSYQA
jgi:hypothetical protein